MKKTEIRVKVFQTKCEFCNEVKKVYYTVPEFGDSPIICKCKNCNVLYWYNPDDTHYQKPLNQQIQNLKCVKCNENLTVTLVENHKDICCCDITFSLDDDYVRHIKEVEKQSVELLNAYHLYS